MAAEPLSTVTAGNDRRVSLAALRQTLAESIDEAEPSNRASLAKQLREVLAELESLAVPEVSRTDELAAARKARLSTPVPDGADAPKQRRTGSDRTGGKRGGSA